jgi:hypothetical protein
VSDCVAFIDVSLVTHVTLVTNINVLILILSGRDQKVIPWPSETSLRSDEGNKFVRIKKKYLKKIKNHKHEKQIQKIRLHFFFIFPILSDLKLKKSI